MENRDYKDLPILFAVINAVGESVDQTFMDVPDRIRLGQTQQF